MSRSHFRCALHRRGATPCVRARSWVRVHRVRLSLRCDVRVLPCTLSAVGGTLLHVPFDIPRRVGWRALVSCPLHLSRCPAFVCARLGLAPLNSCTLPLVSTWAPLLHAGALVALGHSHRTSKSVFRHQVSTTHQGRPLALVPARGPDTLPYAKGI